MAELRMVYGRKDSWASRLQAVGQVFSKDFEHPCCAECGARRS